MLPFQLAEACLEWHGTLFLNLLSRTMLRGVNKKTNNGSSSTLRMVEERGTEPFHSN